MQRKKERPDPTIPTPVPVSAGERRRNVTAGRYPLLTGTLYSIIPVGMSEPFHDNWTTQLRKGVLELSILNALAAERLYGYEIVRRLGAVDGLVIGEGTIYPILNRLKVEKYLATTLEESPDGPARKYYSLTERGRKQLERMNDAWERLRAGIDRLRKERS